MKEPKYLLRIAGSEFVVPDSTGIATLIRMMEDAVPVHARLSDKEIELAYTKYDDEEYCRMLEYLREVRIKRIPAGVKWKRETREGKVEEVKIVTKRIAPPKPKALPGPKRPALTNGARPKALPPPSPQLALL